MRCHERSPAVVPSAGFRSAGSRSGALSRTDGSTPGFSAQAGDALVRAAVAAGAEVAVLGTWPVAGSGGRERARRGPGAAAAAGGDETTEAAQGALPRGLGAPLRWE